MKREKCTLYSIKYEIMKFGKILSRENINIIEKNNIYNYK